MAVKDDIAKARSAGYTDDQIIEHLSKTQSYGDKIKAATDAGYTPSVIVDHLSGGAPAEGRIIGNTGGNIESTKGAAVQPLRDTLGGVIRGVGSVGSTIVAPGDVVNDLIQGRGLSLQSNRERRHDIDMGISGSPLNADPNSTGYAIGKIGGEMAGTAGVGPALRGGLEAIPLVANSPRAMQFAEAVGTGGARLSKPTGRINNALVRIAGGATQGTAQAALANPDDALTGMAVGAAVPAATMTANKLKQLAGATTKHALGLSTGAGARSIEEAYKSGRTGERTFLENLRGDVPASDVLDTAKESLQNIGSKMREQYRSGMIDVSKDQSVIPLTGVRDAVRAAKNRVANPKTGFVIDEKGMAALDKIEQKINEFSKTNRRSPSDFDELKQAIGGIIDTIPVNERQALSAANMVYNAAKKEIVDRAPTYAKTMADYSNKIEQIREIERTLSLGDRAAKDTALRKLQSLTRNNVSTNYGNRVAMAEQLAQEGGKDIMPALAGQALNSVTPRGLVAQGSMAAAPTMAYLGNPWALAALPLQSPRLVGEGANALGKLSAASIKAKQNMLQRLSQYSGLTPEELAIMTRAVPVAATTNSKKKKD